MFYVMSLVECYIGYLVIMKFFYFWDDWGLVGCDVVFVMLMDWWVFVLLVCKKVGFKGDKL